MTQSVGEDPQIAPIPVFISLCHCEGACARGNLMAKENFSSKLKGRLNQ